MIEYLINKGLLLLGNPFIHKILTTIFNIDSSDFKLGFKREYKKWYSDIKHWPSRLEHHQLMVGGASLLLDTLSNGKNYITLRIKTKPFKGATHLKKVEEDLYGGTYMCNSLDYSIWLCNVTKFVFGKHPNDIYFKVCN